jgi:cell division transport system permease protein
MRAVRYSLDEALAALWRRRESGLLAMVTIALALFVLGAFLVLTANVQRLGDEWAKTAEMSVYLADEATDSQRDALDRTIGEDAIVASREFVPKADALQRFKQTFGDLARVLDSVGDNPLPASIEVRLRSDSAVSAIDALASRLRQLPGVADVRYDHQWLNRMLAAVRVVRAVGFSLAAVLTLAAALTVTNVVRLGLYTRRDEIEIMQLVGAPRAYIQGPFVMEGVLQGGLGAALALGVLGAAFLAIRARYLPQLASAMDISSVRFMSVGMCAAVVAGGMAVGCVGGLVAAWRSWT